MWQPAIIQPGLVVETARVHHELIGFPRARGVAVPGGLEVLVEFALVRRYLPEMVRDLQEHHHHRRRLDDADWGAAEHHVEWQPVREAPLGRSSGTVRSQAF